MKKSLLVLAVVGLLSVACGSSSDDVSSGAGRLRLDVRCNADSDCPSGFECEVEIEHGVSKSYCESHSSSSDGGAATCPAGYETEVEHGVTTCKPHGGGSGTGTGVVGTTCTTNADCAGGLECEVEVEHGVTTSRCRAHGGG